MFATIFHMKTTITLRRIFFFEIKNSTSKSKRKNVSFIGNSNCQAHPSSLLGRTRRRVTHTPLAIPTPTVQKIAAAPVHLRRPLTSLFSTRLHRPQQSADLNCRFLGNPPIRRRWKEAATPSGPRRRRWPGTTSSSACASPPPPSSSSPLRGQLQPHSRSPLNPRAKLVSWAIQFAGGEIRGEAYF